MVPIQVIAGNPAFRLLILMVGFICAVVGIWKVAGAVNDFQATAMSWGYLPPGSYEGQMEHDAVRLEVLPYEDGLYPVDITGEDGQAQRYYLYFKRSSLWLAQAGYETFLREGDLVEKDLDGEYSVRRGGDPWLTFHRA